MRRPLIVRPAWLICAVPSAVSPVGAGPPPRIYRWEKTTAVAVKIKLKRLGKIREPYYRIVVADARTKRDGRAIEEIGKYHPKADPSLIEVNSERVQYWLSVGAQPTDPVRVLLKVTGDWQKFTGEPGSEGTLRTASPRGDKKEAFAAAAKASQASKDKDKDKDKDKASGSAKAATQSRPAQDGRAKPAKETGGRAKAASPKAEAAPAEAAPVEAAPVEAAPAEVAPVEVAEAAPVEATPVEAPPVEAPSAEAAPAEAADTAPAEAAEAVTAEAAPAEAAEAVPAEAAEAVTAEAAEAAPAEAAEATPAEADEPAAEATADAGTEA
jgi:small subunit ribosomal protein S16